MRIRFILGCVVKGVNLYIVSGLCVCPSLFAYFLSFPGVFCSGDENGVKVYGENVAQSPCASVPCANAKLCKVLVYDSCPSLCSLCKVLVYR
jgi:hypothetical protein